MINIKQQLPHYLNLIRFDRPIGYYLLLWPTMWSLWIAAEGWPDTKNIVVFAIGCFLMRSAGCIINDYADRAFDGNVERTKARPIVSGYVSETEALALFCLFCIIAFALVLFTNPLTVYLSFGGLVLAACYPFMKRYTHLPQLVLGAAFSWGIIMAYTAQRNELSADIWVLFFATVIWTVVYDTFYAMVDREDDLKIGVKSTAILFGDADKKITAALQMVTLTLLIAAGYRFGLGLWYYLGLCIAAGLFIYQQLLIRERQRDNCFKAFLNNHWVGAVIFSGIFLHYQLL